MTKPNKTYRINLVRRIRESERKAERLRQRQTLAGIACFIILFLSLAYSAHSIWKMESVLSSEQAKLENIRNEYRKYTAARMIVDKGDVELLHGLQGRGIFWTKKLAALANHLPDNYAITSFTFRDGELKVAGYGFVSQKQDQLLALDGYLKRLRNDSSFSDVFKTMYLNNADRSEGLATGRVAFEFSALTAEREKRR